MTKRSHGEIEHDTKDPNDSLERDVDVAGDQPESSATAQRRALTTEWYIAHLDQHIRDLKKAYLGQLEPVTANRPLDFDTSYVGSTWATWTATDKSAFFASLSRHSRYRPDLIAIDVGKSQGQVEDYLELLSGAARRVGSQDDPGLRDRKRRRWHMTKTWMNGFAPAAEEVDEEWIEEEERLAEEAWRRVEEVVLENKEYEREEGKSEYLKQARKDAGNPRKDRKEGKMVEQQASDAFEALVKIKGWEESMDLERLTTLDTLLHPYDAAEDDASQMKIRSKLSEARLGLDKWTRIALDTKAIDHLSSIDLDKRTTDHRRALAVVARRKRDRERLRMDQLLRQGMTEEQVMVQGGPDAVSLQQKGGGRTFDAEQEWGDEWWLVQADLAFPRKGARSSKEDVTTDELDYGVMQQHAKDGGWEVFNLASIGRLLGTSRINAESLQAITDELRAFIEPIILHAIVLAEHAPHAHTDSPEDPAPDDPLSPSKTNSGKVAPTHVETALSMRLRRADSPSSPHNRSQPGMTSAWVNGTSAIHGSRSTPFASSHFGSRPSSPESDQDTEVKWERDSTLTDHEYQDLDIVLEEADGEMDRITSKRLWEGVAAPATKRRKSELFKDETAVYKEYQDMVVDMMGKRRWRRAMKERSRQYDKSAKKRERGALRKGRSLGAKTRATIIDSDDEEIDLESEEREVTQSEQGDVSEGEIDEDVESSQD